MGCDVCSRLPLLWKCLIQCYRSEMCMFNFKFMPNGCNVCAAAVLFSSDVQVSLLAVWKIGLLLTVGKFNSSEFCICLSDAWGSEFYIFSFIHIRSLILCMGTFLRGLCFDLLFFLWRCCMRVTRVGLLVAMFLGVGHAPLWDEKLFVNSTVSYQAWNCKW